jgi:hypothetical protein
MERRWIKAAPSLCLAALAVLAGFVLAGPARAETLVIYCTDHDQAKPYPPETFYIDMGAATVHFEDTEENYTVRAAISEQQINWQQNGSVYSLDRYSGTMRREVLSHYFSTWDCRRVQKRTIE